MDLRDELQSTLGDGFTVERELGGGGMSRVFVARDLSLGRDVVVKVLPPEMSAEVSAERFRREIQVGAQLQHPHIVPLLSAGASSSLLFYSMPLVAGESLRERISRGPALSCAESVRIWRELLDALSYAHSRGIVHRDIKPDNILLSSKHALVTDFGIARAIQAATGEARMTSTGLALGTPAYMAPEQAAGDRNVDARADIYSAGLVMYEMLAGHPPFAADSARQMVMAQLTQDAPPLAARDPSAPKALIALVMHCLAKDPSARPQSAEEVLETLDSFVTPARTAAGAKPRRTRRIVIAAATTAIVIAALGVGAWTVRGGHLPFTTPVNPPSDTLRLTVLLAGRRFDPADANLAGSFSEAVVSELAREPWLNVVTPDAVVAALRLLGYDPVKTPRDTLIKIARLFHTNAYIDLTVSRAGPEGVVFSAEGKGALHDNSIGVLSAAANSATGMPGAIQRVAIELRQALVRSRRALPPTPPAGMIGDVSSIAIPPYLEGLSDFDRRDYAAAAAKAREATRLDSTFYQGWRLLYRSLANGASSNSAQLEAISAVYRLRDRVRSPVERAEIDGTYFTFLGRDAEALASFDTVARMTTSANFGLINMATLYTRLRRADVAARVFRGILDTTYSRLNIANSNLVRALLTLGKLEDAKAEYRRMLLHADSTEANVSAVRYLVATATRNWPELQILANGSWQRAPRRHAVVAGNTLGRPPWCRASSRGTTRSPRLAPIRSAQV